MADNDQYNDEYQFSDLDALTPEGFDESNDGEKSSETEHKHQFIEGANVKKNALIAVAAFILIMIIYGLLRSYFDHKEVATQPMQPPAPKVPTTTTPQPVAVTPAALTTQTPDLKKQMSAIELVQQNMRSEVSDLGNQLSAVSSNLTVLSAELNKIHQVISELNTKIDQQSREINQFMVRAKPAPKKQVVRKMVPTKKYSVQAVIPGRAWLISTDGATLTVSEGTNIPGYGTVKLIDPQQGRVLTSSGKVLKFNQNDS